ncbi:MAG: YihY/virulence factor BrkB family protein [Actinomycetota bacterium]
MEDESEPHEPEDGAPAGDVPDAAEPEDVDAPPGIVGRVRAALLAPVLAILRVFWARVPRWLKDNWLTRTLLDTIFLVRRNRVMGIAAEVAFWAVLSITPLLLVSASALGWIDSLFGIEVADDARSGLSSAVVDLLGIGDQAVSAIDELFDSPDATRLTLGLITSIYASSRGFTSLIGGLDHITGRPRRRNWITTRIAGFGAALLSVPALVALLVLVSVGRTGFGLPQPWSDIAAILTWPMVAIGLTFFAAWLLHTSPAERTPVTHDLLGSAVAVTIWLGGSWITARYLTSQGFNDVLGILGGSVGLLIWLYIMASGILIGAQVNVAVLSPPDRAAGTKTTPAREA